MIDPLHNARSVVQTWRDHGGADPRHWGGAALDAQPSEMNEWAAQAWAAIARSADAEADRLRDLGFLSGHPTMRDLRGFASRAAHEAQRLSAWAGQLRTVESDAPIVEVQ